MIYVDPSGRWCESADGKYSHSGGCKDPSNYSRYVPDDIYYANKGKNYNEIIKIYNKTKEKAISNAKGIEVIQIKGGTAIPAPSAGSASLLNALLQAIGLTAALGMESSISTTATTAPKNPTTIYRSGNGGNVNLTPRPGIDANGLSYFKTPDSSWEKVNMTTIEAVNATKVLKTESDPKNPNHIFILAVDPIEHQMWMASRDNVKNHGGKPYYLTEILQSITIRVK